MKNNITLIGMPGAGKSTTGVILAKIISFEFIDTDILIQRTYRQTLQEIVDKLGHIKLRKIEEKITIELKTKESIISTGGSVVYSQKAMEYLKSISTVIFLDVSYENLLKRIHNFESRGLAKAKNQSFLDLYNERFVLYKKYADITIDSNSLTAEETAIRIVELAF
jgi:shikimate kinase